MLKKANRLAKSKHISLAFAKGRSFFNPVFTIKFLPRPQGQRFAVVISTKVYKQAAARNRLKRLLREHLRKSLTSYRPGDFVIITKPKAASLSEQQVMTNFLELLAKLKNL